MEQSEYEIQHFGFSAKQITLERRHIINKFLSTALDVMLEKLTTTPETTKLLIEQKAAVSNNMSESFQADLNAIEAIDRKYFTIPKHVLLPQYSEHIHDLSAEEEHALDEDIRKFQHNFLENSVMIKSLELENEQYESIQKFIDDELKLQERVRASMENNIDMNSLENLVASARMLANE